MRGRPRDVLRFIDAVQRVEECEFVSKADMDYVARIVTYQGWRQLGAACRQIIRENRRWKLRRIAERGPLEALAAANPVKSGVLR